MESSLSAILSDLLSETVSETDPGSCSCRHDDHVALSLSERPARTLLRAAPISALSTSGGAWGSISWLCPVS